MKLVYSDALTQVSKLADGGVSIEFGEGGFTLAVKLADDKKAMLVTPLAKWPIDWSVATPITEKTPQHQA
jgi:hypothetical protein